MSILSAFSAHNRAIAAGFSPMHGQVMQNMYQQQMQQLSQLQHLNIAGAVDMMRASMERFHDYAWGETARKIEALRNKTGSLFQEDRIVAITEIGVMQNAPDIMLPFIMVDPTVRAAYMDGTINGYDGRYTDIQPGYSGYDHYYYRLMVNGMMGLHTDDNGDTYHQSKTTWEGYKTGRELSFDERCRIRQTTQNVADMIINGVCDPTDEWNNLM